MRIPTKAVILALAALLCLVHPGEVLVQAESSSSTTPTTSHALGVNNKNRGRALQAVVATSSHPPLLTRKDPTTSKAAPTSSSFQSASLLAQLRGGVVENTLPNALAGSVVMALIEKAVKKLFQVNGIAFPAPLGGCLLLFLTLLVTEQINPELASTLFAALSPGAALLAKWLPVFFVPGLAMLPLAPSVGGPTEVS